MDQQRMEHTRRALHGVAELVLAGPQYDTSQDIRLRVTPGVELGDPVEVRPEEVGVILAAFATGDAALRMFVACEEPVL